MNVDCECTLQPALLHSCSFNFNVQETTNPSFICPPAQAHLTPSPCADPARARRGKQEGVYSADRSRLLGYQPSFAPQTGREDCPREQMREDGTDKELVNDSTQPRRQSVQLCLPVLDVSPRGVRFGHVIAAPPIRVGRTLTQKTHSAIRRCQLHRCCGKYLSLPGYKMPLLL